MSTTKGRVAVLVGATGLVGGRCLHHLLAHPDVARVVVIGRRAVPAPAQAGDRLVQLLAPDLCDAVRLDEVMPKDVDDAYCALGTTIRKAGSRDAFLAVDKHAVLAFARAARAHGARRFVLVSSLGADARSMNFYLRTKGEVEQELATLGFDVLHILQPSILDGDRQESRPGERLGLAVARRLRGVLGRYAPIDVDVVGRAMVSLAFGEERGVRIHASDELQELGRPG